MRNVKNTVVLITAQPFEARAGASIGRDVTKEAWGNWTLYRGEMWDLQLAVIRCGPGKAASAAAAQAAAQYLNPLMIISFGAASSFDNRVKFGSVMLAENVVDMALDQVDDLPVEIPSSFVPDKELNDAFKSVPGTTPATILCWEGQRASPIHRPIFSGDSLRVGVDWESAGVAKVATTWDIPWTCMKVISDHGEPERLRMLAVVARRPLQFGAEVIRRACDAYVRK